MVPAPFTLAQLLRDAQNSLIDGNYDAAIGQCRTALEAFDQQQGFSRDKVENGNRLSRSQTLHERRMEVAKSIRHLTQLAVHPVDGKRVIFSRADAVMAIATTVASIEAIKAGLVHPT